MKLASVRACSLDIPFKIAFRHASADRAHTQTLWVEADAVEGECGFGEGCPREYVTGESLESAVAFCSVHRDDWIHSIHDLETLRAWANRHGREIDLNPAAWTAIEIALLDLMGKIQKQSVESLLGLPELTGTYRYSAVLGDTSEKAFEAQLQHYLKAGFRDFKIKLAGDRSRDLAKVKALAAAGVASGHVRADANNLWDTASTAVSHLEALEYRFSAIEEPLGAGDYEGLAAIAVALDTRIVLDESMLRADQLDRLSANPQRWVVNLRVSKMGGLLRSLDLVARLRARGLGLNIGAHVGETSLLTRAALTIASTARDILIAQEGAFGTHLLERDVVEPVLMFGAGGVLDAGALQLRPHGLGLSSAMQAGDITELTAALSQR